MRHTAVAVERGTCYGQSDVDLLPSHPEEFAACRKKLEGLTFDKVFVSPLSRCVRLATACGYADAVREGRIKEIDFGEWEMKRYDEIKDPRLYEWYKDYVNIQPTGGESFQQFYQRIAGFLDELKQQPYEQVMLFAHGGVLVCAQVYAGQLDLEHAFDAVPPFGSLISITI